MAKRLRQCQILRWSVLQHKFCKLKAPLILHDKKTWLSLTQWKLLSHVGLIMKLEFARYRLSKIAIVEIWNIKRCLQI